MEIDGTTVVPRFPAATAATSAAGAILFPWPNRVRGARWRYGGEEQLLAVTEPESGNALHGLVAAEDFEVTEIGTSEVVLSTTVDGAEGYPFTLDLRVAYRLAGAGMEVAYSVQNRSARRAPVAIGAHPYLRLGDQDVSDLELVVSAARTLLLGPDNLPRDQIDVAGTPYDLRQGARVGSMPGHAVYVDSDLDPPGPRRLVRRLRGRRGQIELWTDSQMQWTQVYRCELPLLGGDGVQVTALAVEPMTAPPDALNSGEGIRWVEPGAVWEVRWGLAVGPAVPNPASGGVP